MNFAKHAEVILKKNDYRFTEPRKLVIESLEHAKQPLNAYDISDDIRNRGSKIDTSTVYRILEVFLQLELVHFVKDKQGYIPRRKHKCQGDCKHCHHQFSCKNCSKVEDIHLDDSKFIEEIRQKFTNFNIEDHYFEFSGLCKTCAK